MPATKRVSPYQPLWDYIRSSGERELCLTYAQIAEITGRPFDAEFLFRRKELLRCGYYTCHLSCRYKSVTFHKVI